jgi:hypothetical protein
MLRVEVTACRCHRELEKKSSLANPLVRFKLRADAQLPGATVSIFDGRYGVVTEGAPIACRYRKVTVNNNYRFFALSRQSRNVRFRRGDLEEDVRLIGFARGRARADALGLPPELRQPVKRLVTVR